MENELGNKIVKIHVNKLLKNNIKFIYIAIKDLVNLKCVDNTDEMAPIAWMLDCLNMSDKYDAIDYLLDNKC